MCQPSVVAPDWVVKGCHIHVNGVELAVRPDHQGGVVFRSPFSSTSDKSVEAARKIAVENCLPDPEVRNRWVRDIERAMVSMISVRGALRDLALGRLAEFHFLLIALRNYEAYYGHPRVFS